MYISKQTNIADNEAKQGTLIVTIQGKNKYLMDCTVAIGRHIQYTYVSDV